MLRDTLTGAEERNEQLVEVGYALGVLAGALKEQVGLGKASKSSQHISEFFLAVAPIPQILSAKAFACTSE